MTQDSWVRDEGHLMVEGSNGIQRIRISVLAP